MKRIFNFALRLYPVDYQARFGAEMRVSFEASRRPLVPELAGLALGIAREWVAKLTTDSSTRGRQLPDLRMMRPPGVAKQDWFRDA